MKETITYYQKKLKLSQSLIEFYETTEFHDKDQFVLELLKKLYQERRENVIERNLKAAKFPLFKTFEGYSFAGLDFPDTLSAENLKTLDFLSNKENLILYGGVGTGKTHLSIAIGLSVIKSGKQVYFYTVHDLINHLVKAKEQNQLEKAMNKLIKAELLILDEWGYLPLHQEGARLLFQVISKCYEQKSIIITTNMEFSHWKNFLFDEKLTVAIIDRIIHHSHLLFFNRESYRKEHALIK
ncbi:MAG: IS21-like element helper ATPase IstB [Clostridiales bacterium]|nr:IS21-like element helper ATPase IstB [Clostridiales bacterium]